MGSDGECGLEQDRMWECGPGTGSDEGNAGLERGRTRGMRVRNGIRRGEC